VQALPRIADLLDQFPFDEAVHVFVRSGDECRILASFPKNLFEALPDRRGILLRQHSCRPERLGPRQAANDVVFEQRAIEPEGHLKVERRRIGRRVETAGPECHEC